MVDKVTLATVSSFKNDTTAVSQTNSNYTLIQTGFDNTLSRDGTQPNSMNANLDMNSNHILNLPAPSSLDEPLRMADVSAFSSGSATFNTMPTGGSAGQILTKNSGANYDTSWQNNAVVGIPVGGTTGQSLLKTSNTNFAVNWFSTAVNVMVYGATGNGSTDDTAAINSAVAATPIGGTLFFPAGNYKITNSINLTQSISIMGVGTGSLINCSALGGGVSAFKVSTTVNTPGWQFKNLYINGNSTGLYGIEFAGVGGWYQVQIDNVQIIGMASGWSIGTSGASSAGLSYSTISNCNLVGGIYARYGGDGLHIGNNVISNSTVASTACIYYNGVVGAAGLVIASNVISGALTLLVIDNAIGPVITSNEFETTSTSTATYAIIIGGSNIVPSTVGGNHNPTFLNNHISIIAGGSNPIPLYLNNCANATVKGGGFELPNPGSPTHIFIDTAAQYTYVDTGNGTLYVTNGVFNTPHITNNGTNTHIDQDLVNAAYPLTYSAGTGVISLNTPVRMCYLIPGINFNAANTDTIIPITIPAGLVRYIITNVWISNASHSLTTATFGLFSAAGGGGAQLIAPGTAITISSTADNTLNSAQNFAVPNNTITAYDYTQLYFRLGTAEGAAATATVTIEILPIS